MKIQDDQALPVQSEDALEDLAKKIHDFSIFDSTKICSDEFKSYSDSVTGVLPRLPYELHNSASIYQESGSGMSPHGQQIPLGGAQQGLVFTSTSEGNIVHWPLRIMSPSRVVSTLSQLPF